MKQVAITQRVEIIPERLERRDSLDQRWHGFLAECGLVALLLPNDEKSARRLLESSHVAGIILSGGNDLAQFGGAVPERDATEAMAIQYAITNRLPLLGVCRGMQFLSDHFGLSPHPVSGHAGARHKLTLKDGSTREVNSFHNYGLTSAPEGWNAMATAEDGTVEWITHALAPMHGMMWHPERESPPAQADVKLFRELFQ